MSERPRRLLFVVALVAAAAPAAEASPDASMPSIAAMADVGLPDGATASLVYRPVRPIQLHGGVGHNAVGYGVRGGITLVPFASWCSPTLSVDVGRYFDGDAHPLARRLSGDPELSSPILDEVGYDYANAHVGLQFGQRRASFYLRAGVSRVVTHLRNLDQVSDAMSPSSTSIHLSSDPTVEVTSVSARIGLVVFFL
ncbi:MAG: hypothetical protein ACTHU0_06175 [Kofleriaceae bacterium]